MLVATADARVRTRDGGGEGAAARDPDITVACYYFGQYHPNDPEPEGARRPVDRVGAGQGRQAAFPGHPQPKVPLWGHEDEADPQVMEKKIDAAADHGIDAFIFDWYHYDDGPFLERGLDKGFLKAKNDDRIKFGLMWANHDWIRNCSPHQGRSAGTALPGQGLPGGLPRIADHLIEDYFRQPSYWRIDGKPYFSFYDLGKLVASFGSMAATRAAIDGFREGGTAGFPGLHFNAVVWGQPILPGEKVSGDPAELVRELGFDSVTSYVWIHHCHAAAADRLHVVREG